MHPYTSSPFSELELGDILDGAIDAIEDIDDDRLCLPDDSIEALQFNPLDDSCFFPLVPKLENDFEVGELFLQGGVEDSDSPPWGIVCKKFRSGRLGKQLWSLYPPLWHLNSTATCFEAKKTCMHCRAQETSQWRKGPAGPATLCNACGIRFRSGRLLPEYRPIASPTYNNTDNSNRHKKVLKIRAQKNGYPA